MQKIYQASPLENPSTGNDNKKFIEDLSDVNEKADECRKVLEDLQERLTETADKLQEDIKPLNELGDREVPKTPEIEEVKAGLDLRDEEIEGIKLDLIPAKQQRE